MMSLERSARLAVALCSLSLVLSVSAGAHAGGEFTDTGSSVFAADIEWLASEGITRGCNPPDNTRFCPDAYVTRGQMAAFLVRGLGLTDTLEDPFVDDDDSVFETDIERLAAAGVTRGCNPPENDRFCPGARVTRGQMAAFLVRALGYTEDGGGDLFVDDDGSVFEYDIDRLGAAGVTKGCNPAEGNTRFCPDSYVTRGQMAAFLHRALGSPLTVADEPLSWGTIGHAYADQVRATGGAPPYVFRTTTGHLPAGLTLRSNGEIEGLPSATGTATITVAVTDRRGNEATRAFGMHIVDDALIGFMKVTPLGGGHSSTQICTVESDGTDEECVPGLAGALHSMSWFPDQSRMVFAEYVGGQTDLYVMDADGLNIFPITDDDATERDPAVSPDGTKIAFARGSYSQTDIWVIGVDGSNPTQLTFAGRGTGGPTWSPDGSSIAFATFRDYEAYDAEIYVMDADGSNQRPLIRRDVQDRNPNWSPDGTHIAFDTHGYDVGQFCNAVFVVDADGTDPRFVACGVEPAFSPDGTEIVYSTWYDRPPGPGLIEPADILVVGIDGADKRCVACDDFTTDEDPDW